MALSAGSRLGPYEIIAPAGAGGMGEVYRAQDTRLDRVVAIKVLPANMAAAGGARARFEREARAVASLTHPHICSLYDIGSDNGRDFLVMEYLQGETLAARLEKGALPIEEALKYGVQIAMALDRAHTQGLVHRDLKPANIMLTKDGVKVLDFGLVKTYNALEVSGSILATQTQPLTAEGTLLGTVQYMSPEQLEGKEADPRSDIFAFGAVLYEMITGRKAFTGGSPASLIAAILHSEPAPASTLVHDSRGISPPALDHVIQKCLAKDISARWQSVRDVAGELSWIKETPAQPIQNRARWGPSRWILIAIALLVVALGALAFGYLARSQPENATVRFLVSPPAGAGFSSTPAISPDGTRLAVAAWVKDSSKIYVRALDSTAPTAVAGTEGGYNPFWSPDGRFLGFFAKGKMKKVEIVRTGAEGAVQTLADAGFSRGGTWNKAGVILFAPGPLTGIYRVQDGGGEAVPVTRFEPGRQENSHRWPWFLPDGRHFLYFRRFADKRERGVFIGSLDVAPEAQPRTRLLSSDSNAMYAPGPNGDSGHLVFERDGILMAQAFDTRPRTLNGDAFQIAGRVSPATPDIAAGFTVSPNVLVHGVGLSTSSRLAWYDRSGKELSRVSEASVYLNPRISPNGSKAAVTVLDSPTGRFDLWIIDLRTGLGSRFTEEPVGPASPVWSPDGQTIAFDIYADRAIYQKSSTGAGSVRPVYKSDRPLMPTDWTPDGRYLVCQTDSLGANSDIVLLSMTDASSRTPVPFLASAFNEWSGQISPDGRWLAYVSNDSGASEIYVTSFPDKSEKLRISASGGESPRWRRDGKELYYLTPDWRVIVVPVGPGGKLDTARAAAIGPLQTPHLTTGQFMKYDILPDGSRILAWVQYIANSAEPLTVELNWVPGRKNQRN